MDDGMDTRSNLILSISREAELCVNTSSVECMYPGCHDSSIQSHSLQKNGALKNIADNGKVVVVSRSRTAGWKHVVNGGDILPHPFSESIAKALVFDGFCAQHDSSLFTQIECGHTLRVGDAEQVRLLNLRCLAHQFACEKRDWLYNQYLVEHLPQDYRNLAVQILHIMKERNIMLRSDLHYLWKRLWLPNAASELCYVWRTIPKNLGVACVGMSSPLSEKLQYTYTDRYIDWDNDRLLKPRPMMVSCVIPEADCTHVIFSWHNIMSPFMQVLLERVQTNDTHEFERLVNEYVFVQSENYALRPSLWSALSDDVQQEIRYATLPEIHRGKIIDPPNVLHFPGMSQSFKSSGCRFL